MAWRALVLARTGGYLSVKVPERQKPFIYTDKGRTKREAIQTKFHEDFCEQAQDCISLPALSSVLAWRSRKQ